MSGSVLLLGMATAVALLLAIVSLGAYRRTEKMGLLFVGLAFSLLAIRSLLLFIAIHSQSVRDSLLDWKLAALELLAMLLLAGSLARR